MLFMIIERFKDGDAKRVGERFKHSGRMLPPGAVYHASWIDSERARCFQLLEAQDQATLAPWISHWQDLVEFEVIPVQTSMDFWFKAPRE